jgi:hypothetical protein
MKTLNQVIDKLQDDGYITSSEREDLRHRSDEGDYPLDIGLNGDVWLYRRRRFPELYKGVRE